MEKKPQSHQTNNPSAPTHSKPKKILIDYIRTKYSTIKIAIIPLILFFLIGGIFLTIYQSQQQQELRSRAASEPVDLELRPSSIVVRAGNTFTVFVYANMKSSPVTAMEINLSYPTANLQLLEYSNTSFFPDLVTDLFILPTGARFSLGSGIDPVNGGAGNVAVLKFKALQEQVNPIQISLTSATKVSLLGEKSINFAGTLTPMSVTILSASNLQTQVQVDSPNLASDVWGAGLAQQVRWRYLPDSQTTTNNVATQIQLKQRIRQSNGIDVYTGVGPVYTTLSNNSNGGQLNTFDLTLPANTPLGGNYRVVVEAVPSISSLGNNITFSDASDNDFTITSLSPTPSPSPTLIPVPTNTPSPTPDIVCAQDVIQCPDGSYVGRIPPACNFAPCPIVPSNTPTPIPSPASTNTPAPTPTIQPGSTTVRVAVKLVSIGDQVNTENPSPLVSTRSANVRVYNSLNQLVKEVNGNISFNGKIFVGNINLGTDIPNGVYFMMVKLNNTLRKRISSFQTLQKDVVTNLPQEKLISADINDDNVLSIADWSILVGCFAEKVCLQKRQSDLNDDGEVDIIDLNIFLNSLSVREGDEPPTS